MVLLFITLQLLTVILFVSCFLAACKRFISKLRLRSLLLARSCLVLQTRSLHLHGTKRS